MILYPGFLVLQDENSFFFSSFLAFALVRPIAWFWLPNKRDREKQGRGRRGPGEQMTMGGKATDLDGDVADGSAAPRSFSSSRMRAAIAGPVTAAAGPA